MKQNHQDEENLKKNVKDEFTKNQFNKWKSKAEEYANDKKKAKDLLDEAVKKANRKREKGRLEEIWDKVQLLFNIFKDWINGTYKEIPYQTMIMIIIGLVYFVVPVDIIPDWIVGLGLFDDAFVLGFVIKQVDSELEKYKIWKEESDEDDEINYAS